MKAGTGHLVVVALFSRVLGISFSRLWSIPTTTPAFAVPPLIKTDTGIKGVDAVVVFSQPGEMNARRTRMRAMLAALNIRNAQWRDLFNGIEWLDHWRAGNFTWVASYSPVAAVELALSRVPEDWATLRLGNCEPPRAKVLAAAHNIYESISMSCLDSYLLNAKNMKHIMDCIDHPIGNPDRILNDCLAEKGHHGIKSYSVIPKISGQIHLERRYTGNWTHRYFQDLFNHIPQEYGKNTYLH
eukprot:m51a1_g11874 hypothetical protein (242) ;mRNA; r:561349-562273